MGEKSTVSLFTYYINCNAGTPKIDLKKTVIGYNPVVFIRVRTFGVGFKY